MVARARAMRLLAVAALTAVIAVAGAPSAAAHIRSNAASDFDSRVLHEPGIEGVGWRIYAGGDLLEVVNHSGTDLVVLGYEDEPYLRVGPAGVFENRNSPAAYLNTERYADVAVPPRADPAADPDWVRVADQPVRAWHDHRIHWMSPALPPAVAQRPDEPQKVSDWTVSLVHGEESHELSGELWWVPGNPVWPWYAIALVLTLPAVLGVVRTRHASPALIRPAAAVVAAVAVLNGIDFVDEVAAWPAPTLDVLFGLLHTGLFVGAGIAGAAGAWHGRYGPLLALGIGSGALLFHQGLLQLQMVGASQLPTVWPAGVARLAVTASIAQAVWVVAVIVIGLRGGREGVRAGVSQPGAGKGTSGPAEGDRRSPQNVESPA